MEHPSQREDLKRRTRRFAVDIVRFVGTLPSRPDLNPIRTQLVKAGTSVGANYRSACRAQSTPHFISKLSIVEEEGDETQFWLEVLRDLGFGGSELERLHREADELVAIMVASKKTARG